MSADILSFVQSCTEQKKLSVFPRLAPVASIPALCTGYKAFFLAQVVISSSRFLSALLIGWM